MKAVKLLLILLQDILNVQTLLIFVLEEEKLVVIGALKMVFVWEEYAIVLMDIMVLIVRKLLVQLELFMIRLLKPVIHSAQVYITKIDMIFHAKNVMQFANNVFKSLQYVQDAFLHLKTLNIFIILRINVIQLVHLEHLHQDSIAKYVRLLQLCVKLVV